MFNDMVSSFATIEFLENLENKFKGGNYSVSFPFTRIQDLFKNKNFTEISFLLPLALALNSSPSSKPNLPPNFEKRFPTLFQIYSNLNNFDVEVSLKSKEQSIRDYTS